MLHHQRWSDVDLHMLLGSYHAGNKFARRSWAGFMIHMNMSLINWYYKKQSTIESMVQSLLP